MKFTITLEGTAPLLMHNSRLANPLDPAAKAMKSVTGKRGKTDDDHERIAQLEHAGSLYFDKDAGPYLPADNVWRSLYDAAKKTKKGVKAKEALFISTDINPLVYKGPRTVEGLWADENFRHLASAKVTTQRVMRCRPVFTTWTCEAEGLLDTDILDFADLVDIAKTAGELIGIGDWRPRYGRYIATVSKA